MSTPFLSFRRACAATSFAALAALPHVDARAESSPGEGIVTSGERSGALRLPELGVSLKFGGFVETNAVLDDADVSLSTLFASRALERAPTRGSRVSIDARDTRLNLDVRTVGDGPALRLFVEGDFNGTGGNEIATNAYAVRLRHAFGEAGPWRIGQYWSAFVDTDASPSTIDDLAPVGRPFVRQAGFRHEWTRGGGRAFALAAENPETDVQDVDGNRLTSTDRYPDLHAYVRWPVPDALPEGHVRLAALLRQLAVDLDGETATAPGYALSLSGSIGATDRVADSVTFSLSAGEGFARYIGELGGSGVDAVIVEDGIEAVPAVSGFIGYRHPWSGRTRSSIVVGGLALDPPDGAPPGLIERGFSASVNWLIDPMEHVTAGVELVHGRREDVSGADERTLRGVLLLRASF